MPDSTVVTTTERVYISHSQFQFAFLSALLFREKCSFHQAVTAALYLQNNSKGTRKRLKRTVNKFPLSFIVHIFNSVPYFDPCPPTHLKCHQGSALLFSQLIILLFQRELKINFRAPFKEHQTLTLQHDYKLSTFNSLPCTRKFIFLIYYILHTLNITCLCAQVSCWIRGLTFGQSKRPNHFLRNSFAVISLPLLPPLCFHMCLHNLVEHFP